MHFGRVVHEKADIPGELGAKSAGVDIKDVRHTGAVCVARRGQFAIVRRVQAEKSAQTTHQRGILVHAARVTRPARSNARIGSKQTNHGRKRAQITMPH